MVCILLSYIYNVCTLMYDDYIYITHMMKIKVLWQPQWLYAPLYPFDFDPFPGIKTQIKPD